MRDLLPSEGAFRGVWKFLMYLSLRPSWDEKLPAGFRPWFGVVKEETTFGREVFLLLVLPRIPNFEGQRCRKFIHPRRCELVLGILV